MVNVVDRLTKLSDIHDIVLILQDCSLVIVNVEIVGCAKDGHNTGEAGCARLAIHPVAGILSFMRSNDGEQVVFLEERTSGWVRKEVRATADVIMHEKIVRLLLPELFERVGPQNVAHQTMGGWLAETVNLRIMSAAVQTHDQSQPTLFRSSRV
jgi:hypothetical protein